MVTRLGDAIAQLERHGFDFGPQPISWALDMPLAEVKRILWAAIRSALPEGVMAQAIPMYADVAEWLRCNNGQGLLIYGGCGLGKTLLLRRVLPVTLLMLHNIYLSRIYVASELVADKLAEAKSCRILGVDDVGVEPLSTWRELGFPTLVDHVERVSGLLVVTSNLSGEELYDRYGERAVDRLAKLCRVVRFEGKSFRG